MDDLLKNKIEPYVCLFHYDLPQALQDKGGWLERSTTEAFAEYAAIVTEALSDRVGTFITHNEPWVTAMAGYFSGDHAPGIKDPLSGIKALHHLLLSHGLAAEAIRAHAKKPVKVSIVLNLNPFHPATDSKKDRDAAERMDAMMNRVVLDPILKGTTPIHDIPMGKMIASSFIKPGDLEKMRTCDLLGINYYTRAVVKNDSKFPVVSATPVHPEGNEYSGMWEIYPDGLFEILDRVWRDYRPQCEMMVTENGVPVPDGVDFDGRVRDERRIRYLRAHLAQVHKAIQAGIPISGYFHWSFMDNFEWTLGYSQHFGLVYVDTADQKRVVKDSGRWFSGVIRANALEDQFLPPPEQLFNSQRFHHRPDGVLVHFQVNVRVNRPNLRLAGTFT